MCFLIENEIYLAVNVVGIDPISCQLAAWLTGFILLFCLFFFIKISKSIFLQPRYNCYQTRLLSNDFCIHVPLNITIELRLLASFQCMRSRMTYVR